jgi:predicted TIM-barrel fold metal-dependent hydrolase
MNRRNMLRLSGAGLAMGATANLTGQQATPAAAATGAPSDGQGLQLKDYTPKSMLHVSTTDVKKAKFPFLDWHTHITHGTGLKKGDGITFSATPEACLKVMDAVNLHTMVDLTGGYGAGNKEAITKLVAPHTGRFIVFTEPAYNLVDDPNYAKKQADLIQEAHNNGSKGLKVLKTLGLFLKEHVDTGGYVKVDDPRFDPMWDACGQLDMPIAMHTSEPEAFFLPFDANNERWEEMAAHTNSRFYGIGVPSNLELQEARRRIMSRHPKTKFTCLHVADAENLPYVSEMLDQHPNMYVDIAARIAELGRQPRAAKKFFDKYQDRIVFGTDASWGGGSPQQQFGELLYQIYFRFLETEDEYFEYTPAPKPAQGRWNIYGIGLSDQVLKKVYWSNAARLLNLPA